jgi:ketosteroid isomerase-like protein
VSEEALALAREGFAAWRHGDFAAVEALLDPAAQWRWFEPGEWDCDDRDAVMRTLRERHAQGFADADMEFVGRSQEQVIVVSYPSRIGGEEWPDETATVITFRSGRVVRMQDYRTRDEALEATA